MKTTILTLVGIIITYIIIGNVFATNDIIPDDAIRIRVIANSNSEYDQEIKNIVKDNLQNDMYKLLYGVNDLEQVRELINSNLNSLEKTIEETLINENYSLPFSINFGMNYFPEKEFKGITYKEGYYESIVVTLGEGLGDNWWCVLFPPLCMIEAEESTDVEYTTMAKTIIDKYF